MLDVLKLGRWLDHAGMGKQALATAQSVATRWDVVQGQRKPGQDPNDPELYIQDPIDKEWRVWPHDLRDTRPRLYKTAPDPKTGRQGRVAGRILPDDLVSGSPSSAVPLLFAPVPFIAFLLYLGTAIGTPWLIVPALVLLGINLGFIANATRTLGTNWALLAGLSALLPMKTFTDSVLGGTPSWSGATLIPVAAIVGAALLFGGMRTARVTLGILIGVGLVLLASSCSAVPDIFQPAILLLPACALPWGWSAQLRRARSIELVVYGTSCNWEDSSNGLGHIEARRAQTLRAAKES